MLWKPGNSDYIERFNWIKETVMDAQIADEEVADVEAWWYI